VACWFFYGIKFIRRWSLSKTFRQRLFQPLGEVGQLGIVGGAGQSQVSLVASVFLSLLFFPLNQAPTTAETEVQSQFDRVLAEAQRLLGKEDFAKAEVLLRGAVQHNPDNPEAAFQLGFALAKQQNWIEAREQSEKTISLEPEHLGARLELAGVEFQASRHQEAISNLREALRLDPSNDYVRFIATLLYLEGSEIEALHHWRGCFPSTKAKCSGRNRF
jgi:tetratricopeptide (TPR) repeat protein